MDRRIFIMLTSYVRHIHLNIFTSRLNVRMIYDFLKRKYVAAINDIFSTKRVAEHVRGYTLHAYPLF